jgi:hypothetical protein
MSTFGREFKLEPLTEAALEKNIWLRDLLSSWQPPGEPIGETSRKTDKHHLRLAIRNGYINFYRAGQSVARVCFDRNKFPQAKIHNKYVFHGAISQEYITLSSTGFREPGKEALIPYDSGRLAEWISNANFYVDNEKCFVDEVVSRNPNVIDLEMGLPAYLEAKEERRAPRMDLVALEPVGKSWRVVFWEAKRVGDSRLRSRGEPEVLRQFLKYIRWLSIKGHEQLVAEAYHRNCSLLVALHAIAKRYQPGLRELGPGIRFIASNGTPAIDKEPRLLIDARDDQHRYDSFLSNGHLEKLKKSGITIQLVRNEAQIELETRG